MNVAACQLLRHTVHTRWVGDLLCQFCDTCSHLFVPAPPVPSDAQTPGVPSARNAAHRWRPEAVLSPLGGG